MKLHLRFTTTTLLAASLLLGACSEDFLDRPPQGQLVTDNFYQSASDLRLATAGLYGRPWFDFNYPFLLDVGDVMAGNAYASWNPRSSYVNFSVSAGDNGVLYGWSSLYNVIGQANTAINNIRALTPASVPEATKNAALAEARFMRAVAYFYLVRLWGPVPIIENNSALVEKPMVPRHQLTDVYRFILEDLQFAADNLPTTDTPGRVTSWGAKGMLAKVYLTKAGIGQSGSRNQDDLNKAKQYAGEVMTNSGLALMPSYYDLFLRKNKNNSESLFALQWIANQGWGNQNVYQAYLGADSKITGVGDGWNNISPTLDLYNAFEPGDDVRRKATMMLNTDEYPELTTADNPKGYTMTAPTPSFKKYVIGGPTAPGNDGQVSVLNTDINTYILRLADVYLIYAEAILGNSASTTNTDALAAFNKVRTRAGLAALTSLDLDQIMRERRAEFGLEGQYWFDLSRLHDYNPAVANTMIAKQHRNTFTYTPAASPSIEETPIQVTATDRSYVLPYPNAEQIANPKLNEPAVAYYQ